MRFRTSASSVEPSSPLGKMGASLFFAVFLVLGLLFLVLLGHHLLRTAATYGWTEVPASVIHSAVINEADQENPFRVAVSFRYQWEGRERASETYSLSTRRFDNYDEAMKKISDLPDGATTVCYVNPGNPNEAVLRRDGLWLALFLAIPLVAVAIGASGLFFTWFKKPADAEPLSAPSGGWKGRRGMVVFGAVFALIGGSLFFFWFLPAFTKSLVSSSWRETPCTVISSRVKSHSDDDGTTYSVDIFYRYTFEGREFRSNRYTIFGVSSSGRSGKASVVALYPPGSRTVCFVNPNDPQEAVLKRGVDWSISFGLLPLAFLAVGLGVMWSGLRRPTLPQPAAAALVDGGPLTLKPGASPFIKFVSCVGIAVFWNGIVSVFVLDLVDGFSRGHPNWLLSIFLVPFVLIGIGLLGGIVYSAMALTNPRCRLRLTPTVLMPGQRFELAWELYGSTQRIRRLLIYLEGWEEATYRRGTSNYTDRAVFARVPVADFASSLEIAQGEARGQIPDGVMPSFSASNNKILWALKVHGEILNWPDVLEEYVVTVAPTVGGR